MRLFGLVTLPLAATIALTVTACRTSIEDAVAEYKDQTDIDYADCGSAVVDCPGTGAPAGDTAVRDCILAALSECRPAQGSFRTTTDEGDPIPVTILVERASPSGCRAIEFMDTREDDYGPQELTRYECTTLSKNDCTGVVTDGCIAVEEY